MSNLYHRMSFNCKYLLTMTFYYVRNIINRLTNINMHVYYNTVWDQPL